MSDDCAVARGALFAELIGLESDWPCGNDGFVCCCLREMLNSCEIT